MNEIRIHKCNWPPSAISSSSVSSDILIYLGFITSIASAHRHNQRGANE